MKTFVAHASRRGTSVVLVINADSQEEALEIAKSHIDSKLGDVYIEEVDTTRAGIVDWLDL
jgi:uncharacterized protein (UPF0212 family)